MSRPDGARKWQRCQKIWPFRPCLPLFLLHSNLTTHATCYVKWESGMKYKASSNCENLARALLLGLIEITIHPNFHKWISILIIQLMKSIHMPQIYMWTHQEWESLLFMLQDISFPSSNIQAQNSIFKSTIYIVYLLTFFQGLVKHSSWKCYYEHDLCLKNKKWPDQWVWHSETMESVHWFRVSERDHC